MRIKFSDIWGHPTIELYVILSELVMASRFRSEPQPELRELSPVIAICDIHNGEHLVPKGATGTIIVVYGNGEAYEVEFIAPFHVVVCTKASDIRAAR